jgi:hypothetical protein
MVQDARSRMTFIAEPLRHRAVAVLTLDPANARKHNERNLATIAGSLKRFSPAFKWTAAERFVDLGSIGPVTGTGSQHYLATTMNLDGSVIAGHQGERRAWIWDEQNGMRDLKGSGSRA